MTPSLQPPGIMNGQPAQPTIDTHVIVRDGGRILLSQRGSPDGYGRWHLPSGKLDQGETLTAGPPASCSRRPREKVAFLRRHRRAGPGAAARQDAPAALDRTVEGLPRFLLPCPPSTTVASRRSPSLSSTPDPLPAVQPRSPVPGRRLRTPRPGPCCPQSPEGVTRPDRTSFSGDTPEPARPTLALELAFAKCPPVGRDGTRSAAFLEHQCHTDAQTEDAMHPAIAPLQQPPRIERRACRLTHCVDGRRISERPDTRWAA
ncbi:NUDIX domain-containing protein [Streptomyces sp. NPDC005727]|uniref:NUDIX domain-containing protein n=1 Tax=Streptomyces sp. NPDC005727 TaxID=3157053 RepID=UPI00340CB50A